MGKRYLFFFAAPYNASIILDFLVLNCMSKSTDIYSAADSTTKPYKSTGIQKFETV